MTAGKRALPAAVFHADDPRAIDIARVVPQGAEIQRFGNCVVGYTMAPAGGPAPQSPRQKYTLIEMTGRCHRKVLRALVQLRREDGVVLEDHTAWLAVAADIAAAVFGPSVTARNVEGQCAYMGIEWDRRAIVPIHARAAQWRRAPDYAPFTGEQVGQMVHLSWRERDALIEQGIKGATRIGSFDETPEQQTRRKDRERKAGKRAGARLPRPPKPWELAGLKRSTYYHHRRAWTDSVLSSLKEGNTDKNSPTPGNEDRNSPTFGLQGTAEYGPMGNADKNSPKTSKGEQK